MRVYEILSESTHLDEGPVMDKIGSTLGGIAGGVAGMGSAIKRGYQAGKAATDPSATEPTQPQVQPTDSTSQQPTAAATEKISLKTIKASVAKLNKRQRAALRKLVAAKAGA